jgi:hypothetical protein
MIDSNPIVADPPPIPGGAVVGHVVAPTTLSATVSTAAAPMAVSAWHDGSHGLVAVASTELQYGPMSCTDPQTGKCSFRCFGVTHMSLEIPDVIASFVGAWIWLVWVDDGFGREKSYYAASMQLSFNPLNFVCSIVMIVTAAFIGCTCCCVGQQAVDWYGYASLATGIIGFFRFCGACGFIAGLLSADREEDCEAEHFREYMYCDCVDCTCAAYDYETCEDDPLGEDRVALLIFALGPWLVWCTLLLLLRGCGWACFARKWSPPSSMPMPTFAPMPAVGGGASVGGVVTAVTPVGP